VQLLPPRAWGHTALGEAVERVRGRERAAVNGLLKRRDLWRGGIVDKGAAAATPMLSLEPHALADWAQFVMSPRLLDHEAVTLAGDSAEGQADTRSPRDRIATFRSIASPEAFALLRLLAAAPATLPVMRLLLQSMRGTHSAQPLAEVMLSGLLQRVSPADTPAAEMVFEFVPGVREWLHGSLSSDEARQADRALADSRESIRRFVEAQTGVRLASFSALLLDPRGTERLPASAKAFVEVSRRLRDLRHGVVVDGPVAPRAAAGVPGDVRPAPGALHGFPPRAVGLVPRDELEANLEARVMALPPGAMLSLPALEQSGARTVMSNVLQRPAVRERFRGGIWFDAEPPDRKPGEADGARLVLRIDGMPVVGDLRIELRYVRTGPATIGLLDEAQAKAHLLGMGVPDRDAVRLQSIHRGVPALVPLVGVGAKLQMTSWPRQSRNRPAEYYGTLLRAVLRKMPREQRDGLIRMSVRRRGLVDSPRRGEEFAPHLAWLCPGTAGTSDTVLPWVSDWLMDEYPGEARQAHREVVELLLADLHHPGQAAYARRHLLEHAMATDDGVTARRVLFDRAALRLVLEGGRDELIEALGRLVMKHVDFGEMRSSLYRTAELPLDLQVDALRHDLAPPSQWSEWRGVTSSQSPVAEGRGIRVAIISTGVDASHPELQHTEVSGATVDPQGHGTAVASVIAGRFIGIAPGVTLQSLGALDAKGVGSTSSILRALDAVLTTTERPDIVCLPISMGDVTEPEHPLARMLSRIAAEGILLVCSAGNESDTRVVFPALMPEVLSVGSIRWSGEPSRFSSHGSVSWAGGPERRLPEVWAPGEDVLVALPARDARAKVHPADSSRGYPAGYTQMDGTSFSCACVAGVAAMYAEASGLRGEALRGLMVRVASAHEGQARFDPAAAQAAMSMQRAEPA